jgi:hypothetical protein
LRRDSVVRGKQQAAADRCGQAGDRTRVRTLAKQPAELKRTEGDGTTALHWAVRADDLETTRLLLAAGADVKARHVKASRRSRWPRSTAVCR